ncbi:uncharacterized protein BBA_09904 [Beauveria bassiana ARSEF 2860]|uniref:Uncharacterized protein n=1 Tax=Beauveria bassiana (strain ARSEF 2860) TaxID=655819 RepID=J5J2X6_BEAB2|nr:uncharacterized protein BBA_09904 [Beauveria bassiana ARSEF 2860]EJP61158.1 hypothetical protein BBA_09904 [Beauveria bassiana ARSEF 2860]
MLNLSVRELPASEHIQRVLVDLELTGPSRKKFSQALVLICFTSTNDAQSLEDLCGYDEDDVIGLVRQKMRDLQTGSDDDTWKHQVALIRCVLEQSRAMKSYHQQEIFDFTRTFQQNRKTYLSMVGIGSEVTYVEIAKLAGIIRQCKLLQREPSMDNLQQFLRPEYLPIRTLESLPWEAQCGLSYGDAQKFTAFTASVAREFSCTWDDGHEALFIIFRRLQSTRLGLPGDYLHSVRNRLRNSIRDCQTPSRLVLYVVASFALSKDELTQHSIHEFLNLQTNDVSRATINSLTRALDKSMRSWPIWRGQAAKFMSVLLGEAINVKDMRNMCTKEGSTCIDWDDYWYTRFDGQTSHDSAKAIVCDKLYRK